MEMIVPSKVVGGDLAKGKDKKDRADCNMTMENGIFSLYNNRTDTQFLSSHTSACGPLGRSFIELVPPTIKRNGASLYCGWGLVREAFGNLVRGVVRNLFAFLTLIDDMLA